MRYGKKGFSAPLFIIGTVLLLLGIFTFVRPESVLTGAVVIYGIVAVVTGVFDIVVYARLCTFTGFAPMMSLISGIMSVMCGVLLLSDPNMGKWALVILLPVWLIAHCVSELAHINPLYRLGGRFFYCFTMAVNILGLILGFFMLLSPAMSFVTLRAVCYMLGFYLVLLGIESIVASFAGRYDI